jgi:SRSO17 transposase
VCEELRTGVIKQLGDAGGILVVDGMSFVKTVKKSVGVARQSSGTAGRWEKSQMAIVLSYASSKGAAFIDRALSLPEE